MARRKSSAHLLRLMIEGYSSYSPYHGAKLLYSRERDSDPQVSLDLVSKMDIEVAIKELYNKGELSNQELMMLRYVALDGRLSRRDISAMIQKEEGYFIDQRTISRRLESAYYKIAKHLGFEFSDQRVYRMVAKKGAARLEIYPKEAPFILTDEEVSLVQMVMERV